MVIGVAEATGGRPVMGKADGQDTMSRRREMEDGCRLKEAILPLDARWTD